MSPSQPSPPPASSRVDPDWAWSAYRPTDQMPWNLSRAGHLWRRAANGGTWAELQQTLEQGPQETVRRLLSAGDDAESFEEHYNDYEQAAAGSSLEALQAWWLRRMLETPFPLQERMTLFWHDYFGITNVRVNSPALMNGHIQRLRRSALGDYRQMLGDVASDPAVFLGLNAQSNRKSQPNRYLAVQLLDRWTTGPGAYGEEDVQELARAWTGWFVLRNELKFFEREADGGPKTLFGKSGNWGAEDSLRIAAEQPAAARQVVRRLVRWFVSETDEPSDAFLEPLCGGFRKDYHVGRLIERILGSNWFFAPAVYRQRVKSPVEFAIGLIRSFGGGVPTNPLPQDLAGLGQSLYEPPTMKGWSGGRSWIHPLTLVGRANLAADLLRPGGPYKGRLDPQGAAANADGPQGESAAAWIAHLMLQGPAPPPTGSPASGLAGNVSPPRLAAYRIAISPEYQLS